MKVSRIRDVLGVMLAALPLAAHAAPLNDTGQSACYDGSAMVACSSANSGDAAAYPHQDGRFGRDAQAAVEALARFGGGAAGFDFTKVCNSGEPAGMFDCPADPVVGIGRNNWGCTRDHVTKLVWSLDSMRGNWEFATTSYPASMNAAGHCGFTSGWRLPSRRELMSIVDLSGASPSIDNASFPGTVADYYWTADSYAPAPSQAWNINFRTGDSGAYSKSTSYRVRLVRSGE